MRSSANSSGASGQTTRSTGPPFGQSSRLTESGIGLRRDVGARPCASKIEVGRARTGYRALGGRSRNRRGTGSMQRERHVLPSQSSCHDMVWDTGRRQKPDAVGSHNQTRRNTSHEIVPLDGPTLRDAWRARSHNFPHPAPLQTDCSPMHRGDVGTTQSPLGTPLSAMRRRAYPLRQGTK